MVLLPMPLTLLESLSYPRCILMVTTKALWEISAVRFKPLLTIFHWQEQVTWPIPNTKGREVLSLPRGCGKRNEELS